MVEVEFYTDSNGVHHIVQIETKDVDDDDDNPDQDNDEDDNSANRSYRGHAYGKIQSMPSNGLTGDWVIGGFVYKADNITHFEEDDGPFTIGARVKVRYTLNDANERLALKIETTDDGDVDTPDHSEMYGFVQQKPTDSFNGQWVINGVTFIADQNTQFKEQHGLLAVGAYVMIK